MARYEFRCPTCDVVFEERRPMSAASDPATCPCGHPAVRLLSRFNAIGASGGPTPVPAAAPCGGHCACHPG